MAESTQNSNALEVTVTELSSKLKRTVEDTFGHVRVRGEVSGYRGPHSSGHCYFALKDDRARLEAVIWRGQAAKLKHMPEEGLEVIASGKLTTYPGSSKYQIVIDNIEPAGAGALMALLEERRKKLATEGLFDDNRKQLLPFMPRVIGVVTSPTGAVIRDIMHRLNDRFPVHVIVWPVRVQGETSGREVANGVYQLNNLPKDGPLPRPDVIIVARGGGSLEDLWGFNDEALVRSVAQSMIPVISAVGHETDWTLVDYAADWRAPTPTAAAEKAVPVKADLEAYLADLGARLRSSISRQNERRKTELRGVERGLATPDTLLAMPRRQFDEASGRLGRELINSVRRAGDRYRTSTVRLSPAILSNRIVRAQERLAPFERELLRALPRLVSTRRARFDATSGRFKTDALKTRIEGERASFEHHHQRLRRSFDELRRSRSQRFGRAGQLLDVLSYKSVLARGFAVVRDNKGVPVKTSAGLKAGAAVAVEMRDGSFDATVTSTGKTQTSAAKSRSKTSPTASSQGDLF